MENVNATETTGTTNTADAAPETKKPLISDETKAKFKAFGSTLLGVAGSLASAAIAGAAAGYVISKRAEKHACQARQEATAANSNETVAEQVA